MLTLHTISVLSKPLCQPLRTLPGLNHRRIDLHVSLQAIALTQCEAKAREPAYWSHALHALCAAAVADAKARIDEGRPPQNLAHKIVLL